MPATFNEFRPSDRAARFLLFLLLLAAAVALMAAISDLMQVRLLSRVAAGESLSQAEADANDNRQAFLGVLQLLVLLACGIAFLTWFYRSHKNLTALGATGLKYSPGWAVGGFFVPFLNLVRPLQVMREIWHASVLPSPTELSSPGIFAQSASRETPGKVGWWWGLFLVSSSLGQISFRLSLRPDPSVSLLQTTSWLTFGSDIIDLAGLLVTVGIVQTVTAGQDERWRRMAAPPPPLTVGWSR
jgi:hypothetical protein